MSEHHYEDIIYEIRDSAAWIIINRPEKFNAFRTQTLKEICRTLEMAELDKDVRAVVLRGAGDKAFSTGGDAEEAAKAGYNEQMDYWHTSMHHQLRVITKPVIAAVNGYAIGGGHILHLVCDLSIASENSIFGQAGPRVGSFDAGYGAAYLARVVGEKKAREIWFFCILDFSDDGRDEVAGVSVQASQDHTIEGDPLFWENTTKKSISNMVIARRI